MKKKGYNITLGIFIGLIAGVIVGIIMPEWANTALSVVASIYMSALKMMIFPLVFTSLVMGIIGIGDIAKTGKVGLHALLWYTGTTALASGLGLILPRLLHLGQNAHIVATKTQVEAWFVGYFTEYYSFKSSRGFRNGKYASSISFCRDYWTCLFGYQGKSRSICEFV